MAWSDWLTPEQTRQLLGRYPGSLDEIAIAAMGKPRFAGEFARLARVESYEDHRRGLEAGIVTASWPPEKFPRLFVKSAREHAFATLVVAAMLDAEDSFPRAAPTSKRGRRTKPVSVLEANRAAEIYMKDTAEYDSREDGGAYAVHALYTEDRDLGPLLLSRPMVGHLIRAIREGWLPWDAGKGQLRISDEFRASRGQFVIPRDKPGS
jgi:hypothetical protein